LHTANLTLYDVYTYIQGKYPKHFTEKYKEKRGDELLVQKILEKGRWVGR